MNIKDFLFNYLAKDPDALLFASSFIIYSHAIDDLIDGDKTDSDHILKTFDFAATVYSNPFYRNNWCMLYPIIKSVSNCYADSVKMEKSNSSWKRGYSDVLRQMGNEVILMCIELVHSHDKKREASMILREISYKTHHNEVGQPV